MLPARKLMELKIIMLSEVRLMKTIVIHCPSRVEYGGGRPERIIKRVNLNKEYHMHVWKCHNDPLTLYNKHLIK